MMRQMPKRQSRLKSGVGSLPADGNFPVISVDWKLAPRCDTMANRLVFIGAPASQSVLEDARGWFEPCISTKQELVTIH
jgi:hypothetical protein